MKPNKKYPLDFNLCAPISISGIKIYEIGNKNVGNSIRQNLCKLPIPQKKCFLKMLN